MWRQTSLTSRDGILHYSSSICHKNTHYTRVHAKGNKTDIKHGDLWLQAYKGVNIKPPTIVTENSKFHTVSSVDI